MKRLIAILLVLCALASLLSSCALFTTETKTKTSKKDSKTETAAASDRQLLHTVEDGATTYYCWDDGVATTTDTYDANSVLFWENDTKNGAYCIKNSKGTVALEQYAEHTEAPAPSETEPPAHSETEIESTSDPNQGHKLEGVVTDSTYGNIYYCWDDGTATVTEVYTPSGLTWTHPWGEDFFNIYNGISNNGDVVYSEKTCSWCGNHKTYYMSYLRNYDLSVETLYLCESCHNDLKQRYAKCVKCGYYCYREYAYDVNGTYYCGKCYQP